MFHSWFGMDQILSDLERNGEYFRELNVHLGEPFAEAQDPPPWRGVRLITPGEHNPKTAKGMKDKWRHPKTGKNFYNLVMHLSPANESGFQCCAWHSKGCARVCLHFAGNPSHLDTKIRGRLRRTYWLAHDADSFLQRLNREIARHQEAADRHGRHLVVRLNGTSDIPWEHPMYRRKEGGAVADPQIMYLFPDVQFYDYTKSVNRVMKYLVHGPRGAEPDPAKFPPNYHLIYSLHEEPQSVQAADRILEMGGNVAAVFPVFRRQELPKRWVTDAGKSFPVVDGDLHDLRFLDQPGAVVGLRAKGDAIWDKSGFVTKADDPHLTRSPENQTWLRYAAEKEKSRQADLVSRQKKSPGGGPGFNRRKGDKVRPTYEGELKKFQREYDAYAARHGPRRSGLMPAKSEDMPFKGERRPEVVPLGLQRLQAADHPARLESVTNPFVPRRISQRLSQEFQRAS